MEQCPHLVDIAETPVDVIVYFGSNLGAATDIYVAKGGCYSCTMGSHIAPCSVNQHCRFFLFSSAGVQRKHSTGSGQQISTTICSQVPNLWCFNKRCTHPVCERVWATMYVCHLSHGMTSSTCDSKLNVKGTKFMVVMS